MWEFYMTGNDNVYGYQTKVEKHKIFLAKKY